MTSHFEVFKRELSHRAIAVYMYLSKRANAEGKSFPSINTIASDLKMSRSTAKRALKELEKEGLIHKEQRYRENGGKSSNLYTIL